jgi:hypothetical protein
MNDPRLKPKPPPPDPRFLNRLEYGLQWLVWELLFRPGTTRLKRPCNKPAHADCDSHCLWLGSLGDLVCGNAFVAMSPDFSQLERGGLISTAIVPGGMETGWPHLRKDRNTSWGQLRPGRRHPGFRGQCRYSWIEPMLRLRSFGSSWVIYHPTCSRRTQSSA